MDERVKLVATLLRLKVGLQGIATEDRCALGDRYVVQRDFTPAAAQSVEMVKEEASKGLKETKETDKKQWVMFASGKTVEKATDKIKYPAKEDDEEEALSKKSIQKAEVIEAN